MSEKAEIRKAVKAARQRLSAERRRSMSLDVAARLELHPRFRAARTVLLFHSLPDEPCTHDLLRNWYGRKALLLPVVVGDDLIVRHYDGAESLREGAFRILEPSGQLFADYASIDLAVVPGVAFDKHGHRVGRGRGYYDRLLSRPDFSDVYKLGYCFDFQKFESVPAESFDVPVDEVI